MATIRFIREGLEVQCNPGENLRELVMKENLQLYGLKGILGLLHLLKKKNSKIDQKIGDLHAKH